MRSYRVALCVLVAAVVPLVSAGGCGGGGGSTRAVVVFRQELAPKFPLVASQDEPLRLGILAVTRSPEEQGGGGRSSQAATREQMSRRSRYEAVYADGYREPLVDVPGELVGAIQSMLSDEIRRRDLAIEIIDQKTVSQREREKALVQAGVKRADPNADYGPDLSFGTAIVVDVTAAKEVLYGEGSSIGASGLGDLLNQRMPRSEKVRTVARDLSIKGVVILSKLDGRAQFTHRVDATQLDEEEAGALMGSDKSERDLPAQSQVVSGMITAIAREVVGALIGLEAPPIEEHIKSSSNENCRNGVVLLAAEDWEGALREFKAALAMDPEDDRAYYGAGLACEKLGRMDEAFNNYSKAYGFENEDEYEAARRRVSGARGKGAPK